MSVLILLYIVFTLVVVVLVTTFEYVDTTFPATRKALLDFCEDAAFPAMLIELLLDDVLATLAADETFAVLDLTALACFVLDEALIVLDLVEEDLDRVVVVDGVLVDVDVGKVFAEIVAVDDCTELSPAGVDTFEIVEPEEDDLVDEETGASDEVLVELVLVDVVDVVDVVDTTVELVLVDVVDVEDTTVELGSGGACCPLAKFT